MKIGLPLISFEPRKRLNMEKLAIFLKNFFCKYNLSPKGVYLVGGFARGFGRHKIPDIDILVDTGKISDEELFTYIDTFEESYPTTFEGYTVEFHVPGDYFAPLGTWLERIRIDFKK